MSYKFLSRLINLLESFFKRITSSKLNVTTQGLTGKLFRERKDERTKERFGLGKSSRHPYRLVVFLNYIMSLSRTSDKFFF